MFWDNFYALCIRNNTTPNAVCAQLGFSTAAATHWKKGSLPRAEALSKIAEYFGVSVEKLFGGSAVKEQLSDVQFAFYGEVNDLTDTELEKVLEVVKFIKSQRNENKNSL